MSMPRFSLEIKSGTVVASISPGIYVFVSFASAHHLRIHYVDVAQFSPHVVGIVESFTVKVACGSDMRRVVSDRLHQG